MGKNMFIQFQSKGGREWWWICSSFIYASVCLGHACAYNVHAYACLFRRRAYTSFQHAQAHLKYVYACLAL